MTGFGQRLKTIRKDARLTQAELAEKLSVSVQSVSKWECGNVMPDISQIVPLAAVLGVTTDCLLGVGGDETADRKQLYEKIEKITNGIEKVYSRQDGAYEACYALYKEHLKKYPLDYEVKLLCADSLTRVIYYGAGTADEKEKHCREAIDLLQSVINYDRDTTRLLDAKQTLVILYLYCNDFVRAEEIAGGLPQKGGVRAAMEIEIYSKKGDQEKCIELANEACRQALHHSLRALAVKAKRLSIAKKQETFTAWQELIDSAKNNYRILGDMTVHTKWLYSAYNHLACEYISVSAYDKVFDVIFELADTLLADYQACMQKGERNTAAEIKSNFKFYLQGCYNQCFASDDNEIARDPRFLRCVRQLESAE